MGRRTMDDQTNIQGRIAQYINHCLFFMRSLLQHGFELFTVFTSAYSGYSTMLSAIPFQSIGIYANKVLFFGILSLVVLYIERIINYIKANFTKHEMKHPNSKKAVVLYDFKALDDMELAVSEGDEIIVLHEKAGWCHARICTRHPDKQLVNSSQTEGWIPLSYLRIIGHKL